MKRWAQKHRDTLFFTLCAAMAVAVVLLMLWEAWVDMSAVR